MSRQNPPSSASRPALKPEIFPTPSPLTPEERALIALASQPEEVQKSFAESARQADQLITVAAIHVEPLTPLAQPDPSGTPSTVTP